MMEAYNASNNTDNTTVPPVTIPTAESTIPQKQIKHKRLYKACLNCRTRKVKCDLGPVDNPHDPPCGRCKRERKECIFVERHKRGPKPSKYKNSRMDTADNYDNNNNACIDTQGSGDTISTKRKKRKIKHRNNNEVFTNDTANTGSWRSIVIEPTIERFNSISGYHQHKSTILTNGDGEQIGKDAGNAEDSSGTRHYDKKRTEDDNFNEHDENNNDSDNEDKSHQILNTEVSTTHGALEFLAKAAGSVAKEDFRDYVDAENKYEEYESREGMDSSLKKKDSKLKTSERKMEPHAEKFTNKDRKKLPSDNSVVSHNLQPTITSKTVGSLYAITQINGINPVTNQSNNQEEQYCYYEDASTKNSSDQNNADKQCGVDASDNNCNRTSIPPVDKLRFVRPKPSLQLKDIEYIDVILTEYEARCLIRLFFLTLHPYFPHVPIHLQDEDELAKYPLLLCSILTISSRYHPFTEIHEPMFLTAGKGREGGVEEEEEEEEEAYELLLKKNIEIHERLWIYCQRLISQTVWAEASTRSIGTVLAFLLFTEWNPRAIHWRWSDYANVEEPGTQLPHGGNKNENENEKKNKNKNKNKNSETGGIGLTGLSTMRRSDRMSWMLSGSAVRLAQDMGFINSSTKIFLATHISEINIAMNMNQRSILSQSLNEISFNGDSFDGNAPYGDGLGADTRSGINSMFTKETWDRWDKILEEMKGNGKLKKNVINDLKCEFLNDEKVLYYSNTEDASTATNIDASYSKHHTNNSFGNNTGNLKFSFTQRAKIELLRIMNIGYESIYSGDVRLYSSDTKHNLAILGILSPLIESWYNRYKSLLKPCNVVSTFKACDLSKFCDKKYIFKINKKLDGESLISDYYYCQLYIYSLALQISNSAPSVTNTVLRLSEITKHARYVELAYNAAKEILNSAIRIHKLNLLKYMPVRWVTRIVRSVAFVVKCCLTLASDDGNNNLGKDKNNSHDILTLSVIPIEETIQIIQNTSIILREASPDELHLCTRYSTILMYLCTEMKLKNKYENTKEKIKLPKVVKISEMYKNNNLDTVNSSEEEEEEEEIFKPDTNVVECTNSYNDIPSNIYNKSNDNNNNNNNNNDNIIRGNFGKQKNNIFNNVEDKQCDENMENFERRTSVCCKVVPEFRFNVDKMVENSSSNTISNGDNNMNGNNTDVLNWFNDNVDDIGLNFVEPWTEMIEQHFFQKDLPPS
ncbi:uncharacterized protein SCODWIG_00471 [Saccharomycodes ludwigii]|uniref:Zn(2)-C6 fungal-type domain-containing protein n=1 Tax=Saccharomycodes ludwigii TaxID=36035 RepID=A0A376B3K8_9ASCO|nr:hypothetical protein SCDLUD_003305 [Saccharomycodes ludwigii]KAH3900331.1 hypothetical protein SCDLUD_003305 [Saccharomycodes ludwigii]SSD58710.1 uncharacterized protein SCODWIG_00471 [Saccharomycodes ludwigii]